MQSPNTLYDNIISTYPYFLALILGLCRVFFYGTIWLAKIIREGREISNFNIFRQRSIFKCPRGRYQFPEVLNLFQTPAQKRECVDDVDGKDRVNTTHTSHSPSELSLTHNGPGHNSPS